MNHAVKCHVCGALFVTWGAMQAHARKEAEREVTAQRRFERAVMPRKEPLR